MRLKAIAGLAAVFVLSSCGSDATAPPKPASLVVSATGTLIGTVNAAVVPSPTFTVLDAKGVAISNVSVTIAVTSGGGTIASAPKASGGGPIPVGAWVLGPTPATNTMTVTVAGLAPVVITATARPVYYVDLRFFGPPVDAAIQASFIAAKTRIESMIVGEVQDIPVNALEIANVCGAEGVAPLTETIDDVLILATVKDIDGVGKILGSTNQCYQRATGGLSLVSVMNFDVADFQTLKADGRLNDVVLHEMLHAVGFGTLWASKGQVSGAGTPASGFVGAQAVAACQAAGGGANCAMTVPLEPCGGQGTRDVHWKESITCAGSSSTFGFRTEIMTGFVSAAGIANPLSRITIASLADIGYQVNVAVADNYTVPSGASAFALTQIREAQGLGGFEISEIVRGPVAAVDANGRVTQNSARRE